MGWEDLELLAFVALLVVLSLLWGRYVRLQASIEEERARALWSARAAIARDLADEEEARTEPPYDGAGPSADRS